MDQNQSSRKILIAFLLNLSFSVIEFLGGLFTASIAITSDAVHDFGDALSIGVAYLLERKSRQAPDQKYTYGYRRYSVLGGLLTTMILIIGSIIVIASSLYRVVHPVEINYNGMIILAIFGVVINFAAVYFTRDGDSLNQKSVNLHMLEDVLGWVVVLIGAIVMHFTHWILIDPILSIGVAAYIFWHALKNLAEINSLFLEKAPQNISLDELKQHVLAIKHVQDVHHIHVWSMDGNLNYATMHVVYSKASPALKSDIRDELREHGISHVTIELEQPSEHCEAELCQVDDAPTATPGHHHH